MRGALGCIQWKLFDGDDSQESGGVRDGVAKKNRVSTGTRHKEGVREVLSSNPRPHYP